MEAFLLHEVFDDSQKPGMVSGKDKPVAILPDHNRRWSVRVNSWRSIDPIGDLPATINLALVDQLFRKLALRHSGLGKGVVGVRCGIEALVPKDFPDNAKVMGVRPACSQVRCMDPQTVWQLTHL